ncbi:MAG: hypothetical protein M1816_004817 [Peltula sp. TS41687]|nr:MAG: hypothetical protein M1816_004817 [Peltula sp. TS41687]
MFDSGYFDQVASVLAAHNHPIVLLEALALQFMGVPVVNDENIDLLIRDEQRDDIVNEFVSKWGYERVEHDLRLYMHDSYVVRVPRLQPPSSAASTMIDGMCFCFWSESDSRLSVDEDMIDVPDLYSLNSCLMESWLDPVGPRQQSITFASKGQQGIPVLRRNRALSRACAQPILIPTIPRLLDALLDQILAEEPFVEDDGTRKLISKRRLSGYHVSNLIRYLRLARPDQREKIVLAVAARNRAYLTFRLDRYVPKPTVRTVEECIAAQNRERMRKAKVVESQMKANDSN